MIFRFVWPPWALLLAGILLLGICVWALVHSRRDDDGRTGAWIRRIVLVLAVLGIGATPAVVAESEQVVSNVEVFVVVDRTGSMAAEDYNGEQPRLEGVKEDIVGLTEAFPGARYSIVAFDSSATRQLPLTTDARAVWTWADTLRQENTYYSGGSSIDRPVETLATVLERAAELNPQDVRLLFFLSDGENTDGDLSSVDASVDGFAAIAPLVDGGAVLGYGTPEGGRMRSWNGIDDPDAPYIQDTSQNPPADAISRIDEGNLRGLANVLGVTYVHRTAPTSLDFLADGVDQESIIADGRTLVTIYRDVYWPFVWIAVLLLAWEAWEQVNRLREMRGLRVSSP